MTRRAEIIEWPWAVAWFFAIVARYSMPGLIVGATVLALTQ